MTCPMPISAACGKFPSHSQSHPDLMLPPIPTRPPESVEPNPLERLTQLVQANDQLLEDLATSRTRIVAALVYLDDPGCNARFGSAHLERCRTRHSGILAQLRANRVEALHLLGRQAKSAD